MSLPDIYKLSDDYSVAPQILPQDVAAIATAGFVTIICNRPDGEDPGQPKAAQIESSCEHAGVAFHHIPVTGTPLPAAAVERHKQVIDQSNGPVLAYCRSGQRSAVIFAASA